MILKMDHSELVLEIAQVEKMSTQERLKHAKKRRTQQLKRFAQYEKQLEKENNKKKKSVVINSKKTKKKNGINVIFVNNVVLLEAAGRNDIDEVRNLLMSGVTPDATNEDGLTALHQCCIDDCEDMMKLLIEFNANVNSRDSELWTPLHAAATCGHVHLCKYLIEKSAELLAVNADGNMPYDICEDEVTLDFIESEMAKRGVTQELIDETRLSTERQMLDDLKNMAEHEEDLEFRDRNGATPLHIAAANGYLQVAEFLLDHHVCVDVEDNDSWQPVHAAACWGHPVMLELLVHHGADFDARTRTGETPFDICEDPEMKQRIMDMKDELETSKKHRSSDLRQKRNQNTRSASVRRTSMRDKSRISWKEALDEAKHLREAPPIDQPADDDYEPETQVNGHDQEDVTGQPEPTNPPSLNGPVEHRRSQENLPTTNIDKVNVAVLPVDDTLARKHDIEKDSDMSGSSTTVNDQSSGHHKKETKINKHKLTSAEPNHQQDQPAAPSAGKENAESAADRKNSRSHSEMRPVLIPSHTNLHSAPLPSGTLADLKKHRSQQLQSSLRFRDTRNLQQRIDDDNGSKDGLRGSNGQLNSNNVTNNYANSNNNMYYSPGDPPIHRFTANSTTEIVGGDDGKQKCCCVM